MVLFPKLIEESSAKDLRMIWFFTIPCCSILFTLLRPGFSQVMLCLVLVMAFVLAFLFITAE